MRRVALAGLLAVAVVPATATALDEAPKITKRGAGVVKLGGDYAQLREQGALRKMGPGCEFAGPGERSARLVSPLKGSVDLTRTEPRKVRTIVITGGDAQARGVRVGSPLSAVQQAFPKAKADPSMEETFDITLYRVSRKYAFGVSVATGEVSVIGIPYVPFCD